MLTCVEVPEPPLTTADIAARLQVNRRTITKWVQAGVLTPAITTPGGRYRWRWSEVEAQLRAQRQRDPDA